MGRRVAVVGGGMAGVTAAWELSRPGWRDRFESVTVYQRDWLLGGKGASTRAPDGRILEHGLHVWLGYYDNAFRVVREAHRELGRDWRDSFAPAPQVGVFEHVGGEVERWVADFATNEQLPGDEHPDDDLATLVRRGLGLLADLLRSTGATTGSARRRVGGVADLVATVLRGVAADGLLRGDGGFGKADGEDFRDWLRRHGAAPATVDGGLVRGMYDLVFGYRGGDRSRPAFAAGTGVYLAIRMFLGYRGAVFWKMAAGMGDVVFAPLHEALAARGVEVRYLHRLDELRLRADGEAVESLRFTVTEPDGYEPLVDVRGRRCFPDAPATSPTAPREEVLKVGVDVDDVVLAVSLGAVPVVAPDLVEHHERWRALVDGVGTVATRAVQLWLGPDDADLGWPAGATVAGLDAPLDTCASMSHLLAEEGSSAGSLYYLCSALPDHLADPADPAGSVAAVAATADDFLADWGPVLWPTGDAGAPPDVVDRYDRANTDPSDRYVQALPGTDPLRLRVDGSGVERLWLAGDWTDCGINAGCIEAAAVSGIQAAAAVEGRPLCDRVLGPLTWDLA